MENAVWVLAGALVLPGLFLGYVLGPRRHLSAAFVGLDLRQSALTGFSRAEKILDKCLMIRRANVGVLRRGGSLILIN